MTTNIVVAAFGGSRVVRTRALYQWDYGQVLQFSGIDLPDAYTVHFSNQGVGGEAKTMVGNADGVTIPDEYLTTGQTVYAWVYLHAGESDGETMYSVIIPVAARPQPTEDEPTPVQQGVVDQAIAALNSAVDQTSADVETTGENVTAAQAAQDAAEAAQTAAETAQGQAEGYAQNASQSAQNAAQSATQAGNEAINANTYAKTAMGYAGQATQSATDAEDSAVNAAGSAAVAGQSASSAAQSAEAAQDAVENVQSTIDAALAEAKASGEFDGADGFSPTITVTDITGGHRVTITDATGPHSFDVMDGEGAVQDVQVNGVSVLSDGVANVPLAGAGVMGAVQVSGYGLTMQSNGYISTKAATNSEIKAGTRSWEHIAPQTQHQSTFFGLAKAAGDTTQSLSSNPVGTYTDSAKSAISQMLNGSITVSGTTPTITALPGIRYVCGECVTLDITLPASGCIDVTFESGSTPTVLTVTPPTGVTVKWANGFDPTALEANATYEINIADGLGVAASWT